MNTAKKASLIFLAAVNLMILAAGIITQIKMLFGSDVSSIIPITADLTVNQILLANFSAVAIIIFLICVVTVYLATDIPYTPLEIIKSCPAIALIIPIIILFLGFYNAYTAPSEDKIWIILSAAVYLLFNVFNFGAMVTVRNDAEE